MNKSTKYASLPLPLPPEAELTNQPWGGYYQTLALR